MWGQQPPCCHTLLSDLTFLYLCLHHAGLGPDSPPSYDQAGSPTCLSADAQCLLTSSRYPQTKPLPPQDLSAAPSSTTHLSRTLPLLWKHTGFLTAHSWSGQRLLCFSPFPTLAEEEEESDARWPGTESSPSVLTRDAWSLRGQNVSPASLSVISSFPDLFFFRLFLLWGFVVGPRFLYWLKRHPLTLEKAARSCPEVYGGRASYWPLPFGLPVL